MLKHFVFSDKRLVFAFEIKRLYKTNGLVALSVGHRPTGKDEKHRETAETASVRIGKTSQLAE